MKYLIILLAVLVSIVPASANLDDVFDFLDNDTTDQHEYLPWYSCGHFARDLARNASEHNLSVGSVILSNHPTFGGKWNSHIINYVKVNGTTYFIEPQTDCVISFEDLHYLGYRYGRYYVNGVMVPSNWDCKLAHHFDLEAVR